MDETRYGCPECGSNLAPTKGQVCDVCIQTLINLETGQ